MFRCSPPSSESSSWIFRGFMSSFLKMFCFSEASSPHHYTHTHTHTHTHTLCCQPLVVRISLSHKVVGMFRKQTHRSPANAEEPKHWNGAPHGIVGDVTGGTVEEMRGCVTVWLCDVKGDKWDVLTYWSLTHWFLFCCQALSYTACNSTTNPSVSKYESIKKRIWYAAYDANKCERITDCRNVKCQPRFLATGLVGWIFWLIISLFCQSSADPTTFHWTDKLWLTGGVRGKGQGTVRITRDVLDLLCSLS